MKKIDYFVLVLLIFSALNWGLIGVFQFDLIAFIFGRFGAMASRFIFIVIGIAGLYALSLFGRMDREEIKIE